MKGLVVGGSIGGLAIDHCNRTMISDDPKAILSKIDLNRTKSI